MKQEYYLTSRGVVLKDSTSIRLKSSYEKVILTEEDFLKSNPIKLKKHKYLRLLNEYFSKTSYTWEYEFNKFKRLQNFELNNNIVTNYKLGEEVPYHNIGYGNDCIICLYQNRIYYGIVGRHYFPRVQLIDFKTKQLTGKWTDIKNLAPIMNCNTKSII